MNISKPVSMKENKIIKMLGFKQNLKYYFESKET